MNMLIKQANDILSGKNFEYAFCGGLAIDLFLGYNSRRHSDIDISVYWKDRSTIILYMQSLGFKIYEMLGEGKAHQVTDVNNQFYKKRNIFCCTDDCELVSFIKTNEEGIVLIDFKHIGQTKLNFIEFLFNDKTDKDFLYARNHKIKQALNSAVLCKNGIPYLSPEMCLLYKSTDTERAGYQSDYDAAISKMSKVQKEWFYQALQIMFPEGHKWGLRV